MQCLHAISKMTEQLLFISKPKPLTSTVIQIYALNINAEEAEVEWFSEDVQGLLELTSKKMSFSLYWTGMQKWEVEIPGLTGKFGVKSTK